MEKCYKLFLDTGYSNTSSVEYIKAEPDSIKEFFSEYVTQYAEQYSYLAHIESEEDIETFIDNALSYSGYTECTEEEWSSNNGTTW